jgi:hypothetical protein
MQDSRDRHDPDQGQREAHSTILIVLLLAITAACGYCVYVLLKMIIEGVAAGLSQISSATPTFIHLPAVVQTCSLQAEGPDIYTMTAQRLEPLLTVATVVGWTLLGAAILALVGLAIFVVLAVYNHYKQS